MWNVIYENGAFRLYGFPFFYGLAGALFFVLTLILAHRQAVPLRPRRVLDFSLALLLLYILLARFGGALYKNPPNYAEHTFNVATKGYAAHVATFVIFLIFVLVGWRRWRFNALWSCWAGPLLLAVAVGYVGDFCHGCCYGRPVDKNFPLAVEFPVLRNAKGEVIYAPASAEQAQQSILPSGAKRSLPVHPTQLYYTAVYGILGAVVFAGSLRRPGRGWFLAAVWCYFLGRIIVDPFRSYGGEMSAYASSPAVRAALFGIVSLAGAIYIFLTIGKRKDAD